MQKRQVTWVWSLVRKVPWSRKWQPTPVFLRGEFHGQRSLAGYNPWGRRVGHNWATEHVLFTIIWSSVLNFIVKYTNIVQFSSIQSFSSVQLFATPWTAAHQVPCPSPTTRAYSNSCPSWCHPTISSSVVPFPSRLQTFPASESFPMSQFFVPGGQSIGVSVSTSVLSMNIQDCFL